MNSYDISIVRFAIAKKPIRCFDYNCDFPWVFNIFRLLSGEMKTIR